MGAETSRRAAAPLTGGAAGTDLAESRHGAATPLVTVVIPSRNRAALLPRAIRSALDQTHRHLEVIVVDDASTDATPDVVAAIGDSRVCYIRNDTPRNAAAARNTGLDAATGSYIAFLDSDDEWLPSHLERKLQLLADTGAAGGFGAIRLARGGRMLERRFEERPAGMGMAEYILSGRGDARSSTFVFRREALAEVRFDDALRKHQDWDLAIRFGDRLPFACDDVPTVVIHEEVDGRMTGCMDHEATAAFLDRHARALGLDTLMRVHVLLALRTLRLEGRTPAYHRYLAAARSVRGGGARFRMAIRLLMLPGVDRAFSAIHARWVMTKTRLPTLRRPRPQTTISSIC